MTQTMKVRIDGELVDRKVANVTRAIQDDGSTIEYPEPTIDHNEVVFRSEDDPVPIIVVRTMPA